MVSYRHIKIKNLEAEAQEKEIYFIRAEEERRKIFEKLYSSDEQKEIEINEHFEAQEVKLNEFRNQTILNEMDKERKTSLSEHHKDDSTDDEFFEMPLPRSPNEKNSIDENENACSEASCSAKMQETPKFENTASVFTFPSETGPKTPLPHFFPRKPLQQPPEPQSLSDSTPTGKIDPALTFPVKKVYHQSDL